MNEPLDSSRFTGLGNQRAHDERTECDRISECVREKCSREAKPDCTDECGLFTLELHDAAHESRNDEHTDNHETEEERHQPDDCDREAPRGHSSAGGNCSEQRDENDSDQVFDNEYSENHFAEPAAYVVLLERAGDDRRTGDRDDRPGEYAFDLGEAEQLPHEVAEGQHRARFEKGGQA